MGCMYRWQAEGWMLIFSSLTFTHLAYILQYIDQQLNSYWIKQQTAASLYGKYKSVFLSHFLRSVVMDMVEVCFFPQLKTYSLIWENEHKFNIIGIYFTFCILRKVATGAFLIFDCPFMNPSKSLLFPSPWTLNPGIKINTGGNLASLCRPFGPLDWHCYPLFL